MFCGPGAMLIVVLGQRKWYCDWVTSPTGTYGRRCRGAPSRESGPIWLENVGETESAYESGSTSITLLNPGWATGQ